MKFVAEYIVLLWMIPVLVCIIIPLFIAAYWTVVKLCMVGVDTLDRFVFRHWED